MASRAFCSNLRSSRFFKCLVASSVVALVALVTGLSIDSAKAQSITLPPGCTGSINSDTGIGSGQCTFSGVTASCNFSTTSSQISATCTGLPGLGTLKETISINATAPLASVITISDQCGTVTTTLGGLRSNPNVIAPLLSCTGAGQSALVLQASLSSVARAASQAGITAVQTQITSIRDVTSIPHNGCRPRKRRRV